MSGESEWNSLEVVKLFVSILTPLTVLVLGVWFNKRLQKFELASLRESEQRRIDIEERRREIERIYTPHIEFTINCQFLGLQQDRLLVNFILVANNRGHIVHQFPSIRLRVRGIKKGESFDYLEGHKPRVQFPHKIFETEVVPPDFNFIFVEPGVAQQITFTTSIPSIYLFILANAEFRYDKFTPHNIEGVFTVPEYET